MKKIVRIFLESLHGFFKYAYISNIPVATNSMHKSENIVPTTVSPPMPRLLAVRSTYIQKAIPLMGSQTPKPMSVRIK